MEGHLLMSRKELKRKSLLDLVVEDHMSVAEAARRMGVSYRQALRIRDRFVEFGDEGLIHRSRGRPSNRAYPAAFRDKVLRRYRERYMEHELGPTLAAEKLAKEGLHIDHETLRRWLMKAGYWKRKEQGNGHRSRRERRAHFGELVQMDGSHHRWFGPDKEQVCLMNMIDDATGETLGLMACQETTKAAMETLWRWIEKYGIPRALYTDKKNVYITGREPTLEEQLAGQVPLTHFGKACQKLGIEIIPAHSPQAKGRVERSNGTYQDRFVKELALRGITTIATADKLLQNEFCDDLNMKFAIAPREEKDYHRPLPEGFDLRDIFCFEEDRVVQNDWTIRYQNRYYQILKNNSPMPRPKNKVVVRTHLDGRIELLHRGKPLACLRLTPKQLEQEQKRKAQRSRPPAKPKPKGKPPAPKKRWRPNVGRLSIMNEQTP
jgi:molybdenum-dependent DNA-binding transcriptional regulator ModE